MILLILLIVKRKKRVDSDSIALIGERFSGKTQLFMRLNSGKAFETAPSIRNNKTEIKIA